MKMVYGLGRYDNQYNKLYEASSTDQVRKIDNPDFNPDGPEDELTNPKKIIAPYKDEWLWEFPRILQTIHYAWDEIFKLQGNYR